MTLPGFNPSCRICMVAAETGSWPTDFRGTHCTDCCRSWTGMKEAHCAGCHAHFSADSVADKHRVKGACLSREDMLITRTESGRRVFRECDSPHGKIWRGGETLHLKPAWSVA